VNRLLVALILCLFLRSPVATQTIDKPIVHSIRADGYLILSIAADLPSGRVTGIIYYEVQANGIPQKISPADFVIVEALGAHRYLAQITRQAGQVNPGYFVEYKISPTAEIPVAPPIISESVTEPALITSATPDKSASSDEVKETGSRSDKSIKNRVQDMVKIPAATAIIGIDRVRSRFLNETPMHKIALSGYYLDRHEVTRLQYQRFLTASDHPRPPDWIPVVEGAPSSLEPVTDVSWIDATAYARWAGKRLPTEVEWEYAARGPRGFLYPWGNRFDTQRINCHESGRKRPMPVETCPGDFSPFGLYDLAGNVSEWTSSTYQPYPGNIHPESDYDIQHRVVRGGAFSVGKSFCRTVFRAHLPADYRAMDLGFRCAISQDDLNVQRNTNKKEIE